MADLLLAARPRAPGVHPESRAFQIAAQLGGRVHVVSVLDRGDAPISPQEVAEDIARRRSENTLGEVHVEEGEPLECILERARSCRCEAIVIGPGGSEGGLKEMLLGDTAERLAHRADQPVLIVRRPAERPYEHVVVATDFSSGSAHALAVAVELLGRRRITLLHAYRTPFQGFLDRKTAEAEIEGAAREDMQAFLRGEPGVQSLRDVVRPCLMEGEPDVAISRLDEEDPVDLVVLGAHGQTGALEKLLGGTAERLLKMLPMDVMLVRQPA